MDIVDCGYPQGIHRGVSFGQVGTRIITEINVNIPSWLGQRQYLQQLSSLRQLWPVDSISEEHIVARQVCLTFVAADAFLAGAFLVTPVGLLAFVVAFSLFAPVLALVFFLVVLVAVTVGSVTVEKTLGPEFPIYTGQ